MWGIGDQQNGSVTSAVSTTQALHPVTVKVERTRSLHLYISAEDGTLDNMDMGGPRIGWGNTMARDHRMGRGGGER